MEKKKQSELRRFTQNEAPDAAKLGRTVEEDQMKPISAKTKEGRGKQRRKQLPVTRSETGGRWWKAADRPRKPPRK